MITPIDEGSHFHITGDTAADIQADLNTAVSRVRIRAIQEGEHGILITRRGAGDYTVAISPEVPYGQTWERCTMDSSELPAQR